MSVFDRTDDELDGCKENRETNETKKMLTVDETKTQMKENGVFLRVFLFDRMKESLMLSRIEPVHMPD